MREAGWRRLSWISLAAGAVIAVIACELLWLRSLPLGIEGQWTWPLRDLPITLNFATFTGVIVVAGAAVYVLYLLGQNIKSDQYAIALILCGIAALGMMSGLLMSQSLPMTATAQTTSALAVMPYYGEAIRYPAIGELLASYGDLSGYSTRADRIQTHPPGPVLYYALVRTMAHVLPGISDFGKRLISSEGVPPEQLPNLVRGYAGVEMTSDDIAIGLVASLLLCSTVALVPLGVFLLGIGLAEARYALLAALVSAVIPSLIVFVPTIEVAGAVLVLFALAASVHALKRGSLWLGAAAGILWAAAFFWSMGLLATGGGLLGALLWYAADGKKLGRSILVAAIGACAFVGVFALLWAAGGYSVVDNVREMMAVQKAIMAHLNRSMNAWIFMNLYEFVLFMGPALVMTCAAGLWMSIKAGAKRECGSGIDCPICRVLGGGELLRAFGLGLLGIFLLLDLSGATRGEVGRIWVFFMPIFALFAAQAIEAVPRQWRWAYVAVLLVAQLSVAMCIFAYIVPVTV